MVGYLVEIEKADAMELSQHIEKGLHHLGRAMSIVEDMCSGGEYGERNYPRMGMRKGYMGYRDDEEMPKYDDMGYPMMGMRGRMRDSRGRYM